MIGGTQNCDGTITNKIKYEYARKFAYGMHISLVFIRTRKCSYRIGPAVSPIEFNAILYQEALSFND